MTYEVQKLYATWMWFEGNVLVLAVGLAVPYSVAITGVIMAIKSVLNVLLNPEPTPTPPQTTVS